MPNDKIIDTAMFHENVSVSPVDIDGDFRRQAGLFAYYASLFFKAARQTADAKIMRDVTRSKVDLEVRQAIADEPEELDEKGKAKPAKKLTETAIEGRVNLDKRVIEATRNYNEASAIEDFVGHALEALRQKKDMLITLASNERAEKQGELRSGSRVQALADQAFVTLGVNQAKLV